MRVYIDCEFNKRNLISIALVTEDGREWYEVLPIDPDVLPWVQEHVLPVLNKASIFRWEFMASLGRFLSEIDGAEFIADWPADFEHLCNLMSEMGAEAGYRLPIECTMILIKGSPDIKPEIPHQALSDARALMKWHQGELAAQEHTRISQELGLE